MKISYFVLVFCCLLFTQFIDFEFYSISGNTNSIYLDLTVALLAFLFIVGLKINLIKEYISFGMRDFLVLSFLLCGPILKILISERLDFFMFGNSLGLFFCYFLIKQLSHNCTNEENVKALSISIILYILTLIAIFTIRGWGSPHFKTSISTPVGGFINTGTYAIFLASMCPVLICQAIRSWQIKKKLPLLLLLSLCFMAFMLLVLQSRSAFLGLALGGIYFIIQRFTSSRIKILITLILPILIFLLYRMRIDSADGRVLIWKSTLVMINDAPWIGKGTGSLQSLLIKYQGDFLDKFGTKREKILAGESYYAFNDFLQILAENGIIGLLLFVLLLFGLFIDNKNNSIYLLIPLIVVLGAGLTSYPLYTIPILIFWFGIVGAIKGSIFKSYRTSKPIMILVLLIICGFFSFKYFAVNRSYYLWSVNSTNAQLTESLCPFLKHDDNYLYSLSKLNNLNGNFKKAEKLLCAALEIRFDKEYYYELANIYEHQGNLKEALRVLKIVESGVPTLISPKYRIAVLYLKLNDISNFRIKAKEVISFKLKVGNSYSLGLQKKMKYLLENNSHLNNQF